MLPRSLLFTSCLLLSLLAHVSLASSFLSRAQNLESETLDDELKATIIQKIEDMLGKEVAMIDERLRRIQDQMRTTFMAMPKNEEGKLDHTAARWMLHSYFVQRHGWYVRGLSDVGDSSKDDKYQGAGKLQDRVEEFIQGMFEQRIDANGLDLRETSILAATFENLVRQEMVERLNITFTVLNIDESADLDVAKLDEVLDAYMMSYIVRIDLRMLKPGALPLLSSKMKEVYPAWEESQAFVREVRSQTGFHKTHFSRSDVEDVLESIADQYGRWQDRECRELKTKLLLFEDKTIGVNGSGRVRMSDFYSSALKDGNWQFTETREYLELLGILDTHDQNIPRVVIANYINSPSNCLAGSRYYSVCCISECEDLIDKLEYHFQAPSAPPHKILQQVAALPSSTVPSGRSLQPFLVDRLDEIASQHGGVVPLHGRLFTQWMHHAYPRECPYPHVTGTVRFQRTRDFMTERNRAATHRSEALEEEIATLRTGEASSIDTDRLEITSWSDHEELYIGTGAHASSVERLKLPLKPVVYMVFLMAMATILARQARSLRSVSGSSRKEHVV